MPCRSSTRQNCAWRVPGCRSGTRLTEAYLCFEVRSTGPGTPTPRRADDLDENGRGLFLVDVVADRWAVIADGAGVWCTLPLKTVGAA